MMEVRTVESDTTARELAQEINGYLAEGWSGPRDANLLAKAAAALSRGTGAEAETLGLSHALLLKGYRGFADQVDAMSCRIREQDEELALHREREALTRKALQLDDTWVVQLGALAVRQERDRLRKQVGRTADRWKPGDIVLDSTDFAWQRFETGWRTVPRDRGVQYEDEQLESLAGPLVRLASIPAEVDELGSVPADVAARLRADAAHLQANSKLEQNLDQTPEAPRKPRQWSWADQDYEPNNCNLVVDEASQLWTRGTNGLWSTKNRVPVTWWTLCRKRGQLTEVLEVRGA